MFRNWMIGMFVALLGILDVLATVLLLWPGLWLDVLFVLGVIYALKGLSSLVGSVLGGYWFDWMGATDLLVGISFIFLMEIPYLWAPLLLKGVISVVTGW